MLDKELRKFGRKVVSESKKNLKKNKIKDSNLGKSIKYSVKKNELVFTMNGYGLFVDAGVKGVGGVRADKKVNGKIVKGKKWKLKKVTNTKYKYKDKMPPAKAFSKWSVRKGLAPRNSKGQFTTRKSMQFAIAKSVYHTGIKTTNFFTDAFYNQIDTIADDLGNAFVLEMENRLEESLVNDNIIIN